MKQAFTIVLAVGLSAAFSSCGHSAEADTTKQAPSAQTDSKKNPGDVQFDASSPQLAQIKTEAVEVTNVPVGNLTAPGQVEANENRLSHVVLPLAGRITSVDVRMGDYVRQGQPLLTLESPEADAAYAALLQAQAGVTQAKSSATKAQTDLDREKDLLDHGAVAQKEVLSAQAQLVQAQTAVEQAQAGQEQNRRRLGLLGLSADSFGQKVTVKAPIAGKVLNLSVVNGEYRNDLSAPLMTIADLSSVWVTSDVPETAIRLVKTGEPVHISLDAYPGESFRGRVTLIGDVVDPQSRTVKVRAELSNPGGRLKPEMFGNIQLSEQDEAKPTVPFAAVVSTEGQSIVWREVSRGHFTRTPVTTGPQTSGRIAILAGLQGSDRVAVDGVMLLQSQ